MAWAMPEKPRTVRATKQIADEFVDMEPPPHDRPLSERRMMVYRKLFKEGGFRPVAWAKCFCKETGSTYRVNGKHTSTLLSSMEVIPEFYVVVESYEADTLEDVARLYATFDSRIQLRTVGDINRSFAASNPELATVSSRIINSVVGGMSYAKWLDGYAAIPAADRAEMMLDNVEFVLWVRDMFGNSGDSSKARPLMRVPVVAAMYATYQRSQKDSEAFWAAVRDESGPRPTCPDRKLAKFLSTQSVENGAGARKPQSRMARPREFYVKCLHAWNAWRKNSVTDLKFYAESPIPKVI